MIEWLTMKSRCDKMKNHRYINIIWPTNDSHLDASIRVQLSWQALKWQSISVWYVYILYFYQSWLKNEKQYIKWMWKCYLLYRTDMRLELFRCVGRYYWLLLLAIAQTTKRYDWLQNINILKRSPAILWVKTKYNFFWISSYKYRAYCYLPFSFNNTWKVQLVELVIFRCNILTTNCSPNISFLELVATWSVTSNWKF